MVIRIFFFAVFLNLVGYGQQHPLFGLNGGISIASQKWESSNYLRTQVRGPRTGLLIAGNMEFYHREQLSLFTELAYVQKGSFLDIERLDPKQPRLSQGVVSIEYRVDYIHWWAAIKLKAQWDRLQPYVFLGPRLDVQISPPVELPIASLGRAKFLFGSTCGGGLQYLPKGRNYIVFVQGTMLYDFRELHSAENESQTYSARVFNVAFGFTAGVLTQIIFDR